MFLLQPAQIPTYPNTWITSSVALTPSISQCAQIMSPVALTTSIPQSEFCHIDIKYPLVKLWPTRGNLVIVQSFFFPFCTFICSGSLLTMNRSAPRSSQASFSLLGDVLKTVTVIPKAFPNLTAMWPKPPKPTTPKCLPATSIWKCFIGL